MNGEISLNILDFRQKIESETVLSGEQYYKKGHILKIENKGSTFNAQIQGSHTYRVTAQLEKNGDIIRCGCSCIGSYKGEYCGHIVALLCDIEENYNKYMYQINTSDARSIINEYCSMATVKAEEKVHIYVDLKSSRDMKKPLSYTLTIGRENGKAYMVRDVCSLLERIEYHQDFKYGKELEFVHDQRIFDERSIKIIDFSYKISRINTYGYDRKKIFPISNEQIGRFISIFNDDDDILFNDKVCKIKYKNPDFIINIKDKSELCYSLKLNRNIVIYSFNQNACIFDRNENIFYMTDNDFADIMCQLLVYLQNGHKLDVGKKDMAAFYNAVLTPVSQSVKINGTHLLCQYMPPQMSVRLYIDSLNDGVYAHFEFCYGENIYPNFYKQSTNPFCNYSGEKSAEITILRYFSICDKTQSDPLFIEGDKRLYDLITEGINEIGSANIEIYLSESFKRINVRQPVRPSVGVIPSGRLLELDITADGYTIDELVDILRNYRKGSRYHRFKDGSFAIFDNSVSELAQMTDSLNITDKALVKEKIKIPQYRMLYLDMLRKESENIHIKRSAEFKNAVRKYRSEIEDSDMPSISGTLESTMREYQKNGFQWMRTIAAYGFGGILADDMGLGKTIQAIALMLYEKQNNQEHKTNLVVCPSSLVINWECEIKKFAPSLKTAAVTGVADIRDVYLADIGTYDVIITSYALITRDIVKYQELKFHLHFIDEAQYIKNHNTQASKAVKSINSDIRFALTGTPVENSLAELWSIFDFVMPDFLFGYTYFKKNFENPIVGKSDKNVTAALQKLISPFILRRMKKEVLTELPDKTETIMYSSMEAEQSKVYSANVADIRKSIQRGFSQQTDRIKILAMLTRLRQICCDPSLVYDNYTGSSAKLEQCLELVTNCINAGHKILLFSQFTSMLDIIQKKFDKNNISSCMLTGKTKPDERVKMVNRFNSDDTDVFLISLKAGGTGLNLTGADIVIHYDPWWNVSAENQASDRAYRIGQRKNVQVYKLITEKTIEEKIRKLQESKAELYDIAVNGDVDIMHMSAEDIIGIIG